MYTPDKSVTYNLTVLEEAIDNLIVLEDRITMPQYRRLKTLRHRLSDFLVRIAKADEHVPKEPAEDRGA